MSLLGWSDVARRAVSLLLAATTLACTGSPKPAPSVSAADQRPVRTSEPKLSVVGAPGDLLAVGRLRSLDDWFDEVDRWSGVPVDVRILLDQHSGGMLRTVRLEGPLEFAARANSNVRRLFDPEWVVAVGLRSGEQLIASIRAHGGEVVPGPGGASYARFDARLLCAIAPALGPTRSKLVCGPNRDALDGLLAYATRGIHRHSFGSSDLELTLLGDPLERLYAGELRQLAALAKVASRQFATGDSVFDETVAASVEAVVEEATFLVEDTREVALRVDLPRGQSPLRIEARAEFSAERAWTVRGALDVASRTGPAPPDFYALPVEATSAWFYTPTSDAHFEPVKVALRELLRGGLGYLGLSDASRKLWLDFWDGALEPLPSVGAVGEAPKASGSESRADAPAMWFAWRVWKIDTPADAVLTTLRALAKALADPPSRQRLNSLLSPLGLSADELPTAKERAAKAPAPRGARTFELELPAQFFESIRSQAKPDAPAPAATSWRLFVVVLADGQKTWVGSDMDESRAIRRLQSLAQGEAKTLTERPEIEALGRGRYAGGGFFTQKGIGEAFDFLDGQVDASSLPNSGTSPILFWWSAERSPSVAVSAELAVPGAALRDFAGLFSR
ncbi:MAG TPA: hypothetical protein VF989_11375 [Polyangiaceae bacterium]